MKTIGLILLSFLCLTIKGLACNCESTFRWVKTTIEQNDAGFDFVIEDKGMEAYEQHTVLIEEKIMRAENKVDCAQVIREWFTFFRSGHISIRPLNGTGQNNNSQTNLEIIDRFKEWERLNVDITEFESYLNAKRIHDFEGIWASGSYEIGIKKVGDEYLGFIIKADGVYWTKGQIKLKIHENHSSTYYMRDHSPQNFKSTTLIGDSYLEIGSFTFKRKTPGLQGMPQVERYFNMINAKNPFFEKINENTVLLRIPSFGGLEKPKIDSVIQENRDVILQTPNFIIDLRNNGGGSDRSFRELLPILYTNPIRTVGVEMLSTPLNNQRMLDFINKDEYSFDEEGKKWAQESYEILSERIGEFVNLNESTITKTTYETIHSFPENIGIIINESNGSTAEQFLLAAKQSKKVKLFGTTTSGVLDISNMYFVNSPCDDYVLGYSLSKSMRIPEMTIDGKGIQPDYYIDKDIPKYQWIAYVTEILNE